MYTNTEHTHTASPGDKTTAFDNAEALKMLDADDLDLDLTDLRISAVNEAMRAEMKVLSLCLCLRS